MIVQKTSVFPAGRDTGFQNLPQTVFKVFEDIGQGGLAALKPELFAAELIRAMEE